MYLAFQETEESVTSSAADGEIVGIQFGLASHHEIRTSSISDCPISHASQLANPFLGLPLETGKCESCGTAEPGKCEGHFGYIELPIPVYHPSHITELKRMLSLICLKCLKMKTSKSRSEGWWLWMWRLVVVVVGVASGSGGCSCVEEWWPGGDGDQPSKNNGVMERLLSACCEEASHVSIKEVKSNDGASFLELKIPGRSRVHDAAWSFLGRFGYKYGDGSSRTLLASEVLAMLKKLREETKTKLAKKGYFPQDGYILTYLPVPPNCLSVPDVSDGVSVMSSDLCSSMLKKVLRQIDIIRSSRSGEPNFEAHEVEANDLQIAVSQYLDVRGTSKAARDGDKRFGVSKEASSSSTKAWLEKMRTLFISKGSGFSSRSVITGDAFRPVNEVGIPSEIAQKMTFEDRVNVHNIQYLQRLVDNNLCLTFRDGSATYSLKEGSKGHTFLRIGQVVHRRIMDGDVVFINRPPTTHKHSLQALRVYIHDDHVVKINPLMCGPLAADFDGDCVHLFYPQSLSARAEVLELFSVDKQLLSSHSGNLNLQLATDALLSLKMIFSMYFMDKASAQQLVMHSSTSLPSPAVRKACSAGPRWSAQQILQTALPPQFECQGERLLIRGSEILKLDFNRDIIASIISDILTSLFFSKSPKQALNFFDSLQPLLMENIFSEGFSVSLSDFFVPFSELEGIQAQIQDMISPLLFQLRSSFNELIQLQFESSMKLLKVPISNFILKSSALGNLIDSRSESAIDKIVQQIGFLGLQLSDKRKFYSKGLVEEVGSLFKLKHPFACLYPSEECGLVRSCFFRGLDPYQEMVHSIATREVIVRSSKGLAEPGTLFKNLMAVLRDVVICYDGSVRNVSSNSVIQFEYGLEGVTSQSLFPAGEPVGVLAATAMSNPAYKAVLDSSPSSNSSWDMMKNAIYLVLHHYTHEHFFKSCVSTMLASLIPLVLRYKRPKAEPGSTDIESGLVGHIHLNATLLRESKISTHDILQKCEEQVNVLRRKKKYGQCFKRMSLSVSECCQFPNSGSRWTDMPCLKFFWEDMADPHIEKISHIMADLICPVLLDTVIKGDPRISTVNIVWINPGTTSWVQSACERKGELGVEVTLEKTAVRQSGDAWRIVLDCCLPIFHLIDTRRSIPYAIKQIQDLLGISCGFDQAVQRLSTSVTLVTRGVLKEHLILLASSMTCSGNLVGFNISGIKALCRALSAQVPFTEATLYTPRKCFERASEKRHVDSLAGIVASCSWGKRVAVGTGTKFEILWDTKEIETDKEPIDVYNFLHLVRSSNEEGMETGCLGEDIDEFDWEDSNMEPALSPEQENTAVFEEIIEFDIHPQEQGGGSSEGGWNVGSKSTEGNGWANWGSKKDPPQPEDRSGSASWDVPKSPALAKGNGSENWGTKKDQSQPEDSSKTAGWGALKTQDSESGWNVGSKSTEGNGWANWGPKKDPPQPEDRSGSASWDVTKSQDSAKGNGSVNWGTKKDQSRPEDSSKTAGWDASKTQDTEKEEEKNQAWGNTHNSVQEKAMWGPPSAASWKQNKNNGDDNQLAGSLSLESESGRKNVSSWGPVKEGTSLKEAAPPSSDDWGSKKFVGISSDDWGSKKSVLKEAAPLSSDDWGSKKSVGIGSDDWGSKKSVGTSSNGWNSQETKSSWNSGRNDVGEKSSLETPRGDSWSKNNNQGGGGWASTQANQHRETAGWGSEKKESNTSWKHNHEAGSEMWGSQNKEKQAPPSSTQPKNSSEGSSQDMKDNQTNSWGSVKSGQAERSSSWGSGKAELDSSTKAHEDNSGAWGSRTEERGQKSESTWKSSPSADGWGSNKMNQSGQSFGRGSGRGDSGGGRGWGSSNSGEWKSRKNRPPKQPGSNDDPTNVALTATRKRMDLFPPEEQDALSEIETIMQSIRRIMHQSGCNDGDPLPSDDQSYIINNVLEYHPDKAAKMGAGIDFITVKKHSNFQESRCFFVVSTDGQSEDFSYIKCLENFIKGKHPSVAESFNSKYFRKPRAGGNRQPGQQMHNASDSPNFTQNSPESPNFTQNSPESPSVT
ncbi:hypothetical protein KSS87_011933 [Heliosperma pusillum]|nr:hypothetical protein KSS87_011933 [Heliosperma pusillum]